MKKLGSLSLPSGNSIGELPVRNRQIEITNQDFRLLFVDQVVRKKYQVFCKNRKYERGLMENFLAANFWQYIYISAIIFYNKDCSQKINLFSKDLVHFRIKF